MKPDAGIQRDLPQPNFWMSVVLLLLVLGGQMMMGVPLGVLDLVMTQVLDSEPLQLTHNALALAFINLVALGGAVAFGLYLNRMSFRQAFSFGAITILQALWAGMAVIGTSFVLSEIDNVLRFVCPPPPAISEVFDMGFLEHGQPLSQLFLLVVVAPVTEELLFRGLILRGLLTRHRPLAAVLLSSLLFALLHVNPWQFVSTFALGVLFAWFYLRTGSLGLCMFGHAVTNGLYFLFLALPWEVPGLTHSLEDHGAAFQPWFVDLGGTALLLIGVLFLIRATPQPRAYKGSPPPVMGPDFLPEEVPPVIPSVMMPPQVRSKTEAENRSLD
jgi:uncharacterized protein